MRNKLLIYWIIQFISWGLLCVFFVVIAILDNNITEYTPLQAVILYIFLILASHIIRCCFIKRKWLSLGIKSLIPRTFLLIITLSIVLSLLLKVGVDYLILKMEINVFLEFITNVIFLAIFLIFWTAVYLTFHLFEKSRVQEVSNLKLQASQAKNELKVLRNQLNPHFLFNSLHTIRALVEIDPPTAKEAITLLSRLLRNSLLMSKKEFVCLSEEMQLVTEYLALEKIRHEDYLNYSINNQVSEDLLVPQFILQGLVENAIKHGIAKLSTQGEININVYFDEENLLMEVLNTGTYQSSNSEGIGIENTQRRLELFYGEFAGHSIKNDEELKMVRAKIWINKNKVKAAE